MGLFERIPLATKIRAALAVAEFRAKDFHALDNLVRGLAKHPAFGVLLPDVKDFNSAVTAISSGGGGEVWKTISPSVRSLLANPILRRQIASSLHQILGQNPDQHASIMTMLAKVAYSPIGGLDESVEFEDETAFLSEGIFPILERHLLPGANNTIENGGRSTIVHKCRFCNELQQIELS